MLGRRWMTQIRLDDLVRAKDQAKADSPVRPRGYVAAHRSVERLYAPPAEAWWGVRIAVANTAVARRSRSGLVARLPRRWEEDTVDDVDDAIRSHDICRHDLDRPVKNDLTVDYLDRDVRTANSCCRGQVDHGGCPHITRDDVVQENVCQRGDVLK